MNRIALASALGLTALAASPAAHADFTLIDASGLEFYFNADVTYSSSSASGAASDATYTQAVPTTTSGGGTVSTTLSDAFDGYNAVSINGTVYTNNGAATSSSDCSDREYTFTPQLIDDLTVSRRVFVPDNDEFARWITQVNNTSSADVEVEFIVWNNLGSDSNMVITGSSSGDTTAGTNDTWVTTGGDYWDPRLAHVLGNEFGRVTATAVTFTDGDDQPTWTYSFTLPANQSASIMNLVSGQPTDADAQTAGSYLEGLPANVTACMSAPDFNSLVNFGAPADCSDLNTDCTFGAYDPSVGDCVALPANEGGSCDDGDECTETDVCNTGECSGTLIEDCGGDDGTDGTDGSDGADGADGTDGTTTDGSDGTDGTDGSGGGKDSGGVCSAVPGGTAPLAALCLIGVAIGRRRR